MILTVRDFVNKLTGRSLAYNKVFDKQSPFTNDVLKDLAKFCRLHESTFAPDPRAHALLEGRREVLLRILEHLHLTVDQLYELHKVREYGGDTREQGRITSQGSR